MAEPDLVLKNVLLWGHEGPTDLCVQNGKVASVGPSDLPGEDCSGRLLMPGFVEPHVHLDKTLSLGAGGLENESGTLQEAIERWGGSEPGRHHADFVGRADAALRLALSRGVTALRTHVNVGSSSQTALEALLDVRQSWRGRIDVQLVARQP